MVSHEMFRPPVNRAMRVLDRNFFQKDVQISAARIFDVKNISRVRNEFTKSNDVLSSRHINAVLSIRPDPTDRTMARKCLLLRPGIKHDGIS